MSFATIILYGTVLMTDATTMLSDPAERDAMVTGPAIMETFTPPAMEACASREPA